MAAAPGEDCVQYATQSSTSAAALRATMNQLEQLKQYTTVVADTGDFQLAKDVIFELEQDDGSMMRVSA
eukprot:gene2891-3739_t